ncbi:MAG TPA: lasso peptide biosynthesis PqqD family chaperone [Bacteroidales bacterium]|nr:lasso peptide biosynthesis PqqD family chaperone [Bacteroidales bacterium]
MKTKLTELSKVKRNPALVTSNIDGEIVMMSVENGEYYGLDEIGTRIWDLLENSLLVNELVDKLIEEFEVGKEDCTRDTLEFLNDLLSRNLLVVEQ